MCIWKDALAKSMDIKIQDGLQPAHQAIRNQLPTSSTPARFLTAIKATCLCVESPLGVISPVLHKLRSLKHSQFLDRHPAL